MLSRDWGGSCSLPAWCRAQQPGRMAKEMSGGVDCWMVGRCTFQQSGACFTGSILSVCWQTKGRAGGGADCSSQREDRNQGPGHPVGCPRDMAGQRQSLVPTGTLPWDLATAPGSAGLCGWGPSPSFNLQLCPPYSGQAAWSWDKGEGGR